MSFVRLLFNISKFVGGLKFTSRNKLLEMPMIKLYSTSLSRLKLMKIQLVAASEAD